LSGFDRARTGKEKLATRGLFMKAKDQSPRGAALFLFLIGLKLAVCCAAVPAMTGLDQWELRYQSYQGYQMPRAISAVASDGESTLAAGYGAAYLISTNGGTWAVGSFPGFTNGTIDNTAVGNGVILAGGTRQGNGYAAGYVVFLSKDGHTWKTPQLNTVFPSVTQNKKIAFLGDRFVGVQTYVGMAGSGITPHRFATSTDGEVWVWKDSTLRSRVSAITFGDGKFLAVGDNGTVWHSANGLDWEEKAVIPMAVTGCAYGKGMFVAVGKLGYVASSLDGIRWDVRQQPNAIEDFTEVQFGNGLFIASITQTPSERFEGVWYYFKSGNGTDWQPSMLLPRVGASVPGTRAPFSVSKAGVVVMLGGGTTPWFSNDGTNWSEGAVPPQWQWRFRQASTGQAQWCVAGRYFILGSVVSSAVPQQRPNPALFFSPDGISWSVNTPLWLPAGRHGYVAAGEEILALQGSRVVASPDGLNWSIRYADASLTLNGIAVDRVTGQITVLGMSHGGRMAVATSSDGHSWTKKVGGLVGFPLPQMENVVAANGVIVACDGGQRADGTYTGTLVTSRDGLKWERVLANAARMFRGAAFGNGLFLVGSAGTKGNAVVRSTDGVHWKEEPAPSDLAPDFGSYGIVYGNGWFLALGRKHLWASVDGVQWNPVADTDAAEGILFGQGKFLRFSDLKIWQSHEVIPPFEAGVTADANGFLFSRASVAGMGAGLEIRFVVERARADGSVARGDPDSILIRPGETFARLTLIPDGFAKTAISLLPGEAYRIGPDAVAAVESASPARGPRLLPDAVSRQPDGTVVVRSPALPNAPAILEFSEDLLTWTPVGGCGGQAGGLCDEDARGRQWRFYRLRLP
jgi:hypothetical protein